MEHQWESDRLILILTKDDFPVDRDIVEAVWTLAMSDESAGKALANFMVLCLSLLFKGVLQFL
jgi:hypothetical protein